MHAYVDRAYACARMRMHAHVSHSYVDIAEVHLFS